MLGLKLIHISKGGPVYYVYIHLCYDVINFVCQIDACIGFTQPYAACNLANSLMKIDKMRVMNVTVHKPCVSLQFVCLET